MNEPRQTAYAAAGVDVRAGDRAVELMKAHVGKATRPEVVGGLGGFAGLFDASALKAYTRPVLATSADGVGTKVAIARALDRYDTIGYDLVGMLVDDLVVVGAEPWYLTDYIACGRIVPERIAAIVAGIAAACAQAGTALIGGETAEHPGLMEPDEFDLAGATTGVVEFDAMLGPDRVRPGDRLVCLASSGLHSNGFSLVRRVLDQAHLDLSAYVADFGQTLGEELLTPTRVYAADCLAVIRTTEVHAMSHITGGGLAANLARVIPGPLVARVDRSTWTPQPVFQMIQRAGRLGEDDIEEALNLGVGMVMVAPPESADAVLAGLAGRGVTAWDGGAVGQRDPGETGARLYGRHPGAD